MDEFIEIYWDYEFNDGECGECNCANPLALFDSINEVLFCSYCLGVIEDDEGFI